MYVGFGLMWVLGLYGFFGFMWVLGLSGFMYCDTGACTSVMNNHIRKLA